MELAKMGRRAGSGSIFSTLSRFPDRLFTINELAKIAGIPFATTWRTINEWEKAGAVETLAIGKARAVKLREGSMLKNLSKLFSMESPQKLSLKTLKRLLVQNKEIKEAYVFGSVARREEKLESDIDIALLAKKSYLPNALSARFYQMTKMKLVPLAFSSESDLKKFIEGKKTVRLK